METGVDRQGCRNHKVAALGTSSVAAMLLGGDTGRQLEGMLSEAKIKVLKVELEGQTRTN